jgi:GH43 family beta-xylosidase
MTMSVSSLLCLVVLLFSPLVWGASFNASHPRGVFQNPIRDDSWPDPYCYLHTDGFYYMPRSENNGIALYRSPILHNWRQAERAFVYQAPPGLMSLWAPEVFFLRGNWYLYFALDDGNNANHRMYVVRANDPQNPMGAWGREKRMVVPGEDVWAIDGTVLEYGNGQLYFIWSGWPTIDAGFPQNLYIAPMSDPETISGPRVLINWPMYDWQMMPEPLLEGPQILHNKGRVFVVYSCSGSWTADYQLGFMGIDDLRDPLVPNNWWRHDRPVFWRNDAESVYGVGHASFTTSKDGSEPWIVYHAMARPDAGWAGRTARIEKFGWNPDNSPAFPRPAGLERILETPIGE